MLVHNLIELLEKEDANAEVEFVLAEEAYSIDVVRNLRLLYKEPTGEFCIVEPGKVQLFPSYKRLEQK